MPITRGNLLNSLKFFLFCFVFLFSACLPANQAKSDHNYFGGAAVMLTDKKQVQRLIDFCGLLVYNAAPQFSGQPVPHTNRTQPSVTTRTNCYGQSAAISSSFVSDIVGELASAQGVILSLHLFFYLFSINHVCALLPRMTSDTTTTAANECLPACLGETLE